MRLEDSAKALRDSDALEAILNNMEIECIAQFKTCPVEKLVELQNELLAVDALRSAISSKLHNILETVDG